VSSSTTDSSGNHRRGQSRQRRSGPSHHISRAGSLMQDSSKNIVPWTPKESTPPWRGFYPSPGRQDRRWRSHHIPRTWFCVGGTTRRALEQRIYGMRLRLKLTGTTAEGLLGVITMWRDGGSASARAGGEGWWPISPLQRAVAYKALHNMPTGARSADRRQYAISMADQVKFTRVFYRSPAAGVQWGTLPEVRTGTQRQ